MKTITANTTMQVTTAAESAVLGESAGTRSCRSRAMASIISMRNTASASGVRIGASHTMVAPERITAITIRALRAALGGAPVIGASVLGAALVGPSDMGCVVRAVEGEVNRLS